MAKFGSFVARREEQRAAQRRRWEALETKRQKEQVMRDELDSAIIRGVTARTSFAALAKSLEGSLGPDAPSPEEGRLRKRAFELARASPVVDHVAACRGAFSPDGTSSTRTQTSPV